MESGDSEGEGLYPYDTCWSLFSFMLSPRWRGGTATKPRSALANSMTFAGGPVPDAVALRSNSIGLFWQHLDSVHDQEAESVSSSPSENSPTMAESTVDYAAPVAATFAGIEAAIGRFRKGLSVVGFVCCRDQQRDMMHKVFEAERQFGVLCRLLVDLEQAITATLGAEAPPADPDVMAVPQPRGDDLIFRSDPTGQSIFAVRVPDDLEPESAANAEPFGPYQRQFLERWLPLCSPAAADELAIALFRMHSALTNAPRPDERHRWWMHAATMQLPTLAQDFVAGGHLVAHQVHQYAHEHYDLPVLADDKHDRVIAFLRDYRVPGPLPTD
ncbi:hypothetical protein [Nocardia suismassiliense]|uniref:hypothetical protein n=1 Tax=Nocardia suismassiliense TaxID=2077092 RepID=UPI00131F2AF7|nr:hypothetical protein [Nocardia suismassiliense]